MKMKITPTNTRTTVMRFTERDVATILAGQAQHIATIGDHMTVRLVIDRIGSPIGPQVNEYVVTIVEDFDKLPRPA